MWTVEEGRVWSIWRNTDVVARVRARKAHVIGPLTNGFSHLDQRERFLSEVAAEAEAIREDGQQTAAAVVGAGPGVKDNEQLNGRLRDIAAQAGLLFFEPENVVWRPDGRRPVNPKALRQHICKSLGIEVEGATLEKLKRILQRALRFDYKRPDHEKSDRERSEEVRLRRMYGDWYDQPDPIVKYPVVGSDEQFNRLVRNGRLTPNLNGLYQAEKVMELLPAASPQVHPKAKLKPASESKIRAAITNVYAAKDKWPIKKRTGKPKPPNVKEIGELVQAQLRSAGFQATQSQIQNIANEEPFKSMREKTGREATAS